jgi:hypothetical protein
VTSDLFNWTPAAKYPSAPGFKESTTSREAACKMAPRARTIRDQVHAALRNAWPNGLTADEVSTLIGKSPFAVRPRLSEMREMNQIFPALLPNGEHVRRPNASGLNATVWVCKRPEGV